MSRRWRNKNQSGQIPARAVRGIEAKIIEKFAS
jgi:hypothetical protein